MSWPSPAYSAPLDKPRTGDPKSLVRSPSLPSFQDLIPPSSTVRSMTIRTFVQWLRSHKSNSKIHQIVLRKEAKVERHEYLLVEAEILSGQRFWIRLDRGRRPKGDRLAFWSRSQLRLDDSASLANTEKKLTRGKGAVIATLRFSQPENITLNTLQALLSAFEEDSFIYTLPERDAVFFCSVVLHILSDHFPSKLEGTLTKFGPVSNRIKDRFHHLEECRKFSLVDSFPRYVQERENLRGHSAGTRDRVDENTAPDADAGLERETSASQSPSHDCSDSSIIAVEINPEGEVTSKGTREDRQRSAIAPQSPLPPSTLAPDESQESRQSNDLGRIREESAWVFKPLKLTSRQLSPPRALRNNDRGNILKSIFSYATKKPTTTSAEKKPDSIFITESRNRKTGPGEYYDPGSEERKSRCVPRAGTPKRRSIRLQWCIAF